VDDEVRRCSRFKREAWQTYVQLDNEPRRKKGAPRKTVSFSTISNLKNASAIEALKRTWMIL
jgi:hypothetical protein